MKRTIVIIGTYNEKENLEPLVWRILALGMGIDVLVIDDNSPDGTGRIADGLASRHREVSVMHRPKKLGLGTAYIAGFRRAMEAGYENIITMDADFSHDPKYIPAFIDGLETHDVVAGTRYMPGGGVVNWPLWRRCLSRGGSLYTRLITRMPLRDATGGFNGFRKETLQAIRPEQIRSEGYSFQIEMKFRSWRAGFKILETPIVFADRTRGRSKMSRRIFLEAMWRVWKMR